MPWIPAFAGMTDRGLSAGIFPYARSLLVWAVIGIRFWTRVILLAAGPACQLGGASATAQMDV